MIDGEVLDCIFAQVAIDAKQELFLRWSDRGPTRN
jgi:hypothetical protein